MVDGADSGRQRRRSRTRRVQLACVPCRNGKLKCDRDLPACDQCVRRSRGSACAYTERGLRHNAARRQAESMRDKIDRLESFVGRLKGGGAGDVLTPRSPPRRRAHPPLDGGVGGVDVDAAPAGSDGTSPSTRGLQLDGADGRTRWVGPSHWESIMEDIADVKSYFDVHGHGHDPDSTDGADLTPSSVARVDVPSGISQTVSLDELVRLLPPRLECDGLVAAWFNSMDSMRTLLHASTFQADYRRLWERPLAAGAQSLSLLFAVLSLGAELAAQRRDDAAMASKAEDLRRLSLHALVLAGHPRLSLDAVTTTLLLVKSRLLSLHDVDARTWLDMGIVTRLAFKCGLHRDPGGGTRLPPLVCEMRRRIWLHVREIDVLTSYQFGVHSLMNLMATDTLPPGNLLDLDLTRDGVAPHRPREDYTEMLYTIHHGRLVTLFGESVISSHALTPPADAEIAGIRDRLEDWRADLPEILRPVPVERAFLDPAELLLNRFHLEVIRLRASIVLHRRFLDRPSHGPEGARCLDACEASLLQQVDFLAAVVPGGPLEHTKIYTRRHTHDFNLAAMLMCSHIRTVEAAGGAAGAAAAERVARVRPLILEACNLWLTTGAISPRATQALRAIERFVSSRPSPPTATATATSDWGHVLARHAGSAAGPAASDAVDTREFGVGPVFPHGRPHDPMDASDPLFAGLFAAPADQMFADAQPSWATLDEGLGLWAGGWAG